VAAALGEVVPLRTIYVSAGVFVSAGGLVGLLVLQEPAAAVEETAPGETLEAEKKRSPANS
jgi:hypothetical protein